MRANAIATGAAILLFLSHAVAQSTAPAAFPADAVVLDDVAARAKIAGRSFVGGPADNWRFQYDDKYVYSNIAGGGNRSGRWRIEGTQLCIEWNVGRGGGCSQVRFRGDNYLVEFQGGIHEMKAH